MQYSWWREDVCMPVLLLVIFLVTNYTFTFMCWYRLKESVQRITSVRQDHGWNTEDIWTILLITCSSRKYQNNILQIILWMCIWLVCIFPHWVFFQSVSCHFQFRDPVVSICGLWVVVKDILTLFIFNPLNLMCGQSPLYFDCQATCNQGESGRGSIGSKILVSLCIFVCELKQEKWWIWTIPMYHPEVLHNSWYIDYNCKLAFIRAL